MQAVRALFDGSTIRPIAPITIKKKTEVLVIFPDAVEKLIPGESRRLWKGRVSIT